MEHKEKVVQFGKNFHYQCSVEFVQVRHSTDAALAIAYKKTQVQQLSSAPLHATCKIPFMQDVLHASGAHNETKDPAQSACNVPCQSNASLVHSSTDVACTANRTEEEEKEL